LRSKRAIEVNIEIVRAFVKPRDPARFEWREVTKIAHYWLEVNAMTKPMQVREDEAPCGEKDQQ